jgi:hypothetical protein
MSDGALMVRFRLDEITGNQWGFHQDRGDVRLNVKAGDTAPWQRLAFRSGGEGGLRALPGDWQGTVTWVRVIHDQREISSQVPVPFNCAGVR